jgi:hypothetical protein
MVLTLNCRPGSSDSSNSIVIVSLPAGAIGAAPDADAVTAVSASASASKDVLSPPSAISSNPGVDGDPTTNML